MPRERSQIPWLVVRNGVYYVMWYDTEAAPARTRRLSLATTDPVEAQQRFAKFLAAGHAALAPNRGLTVSQALDDYLREHVAKKVVDKDRAEVIIGHLKSWFKDGLLKDIDIPASRAYADARRQGVIGGGKRRRDAKGSDSTIRRELVVLSAAAQHALSWKRVSHSDLPSIELPAEAVRKEIWLTRTELTRAIAAATSERLRAFIQIAYYTAARRASIERLTRFQVDLPNSRINLTSPHETENQRRSVKRRPVVPIDPVIRPVIEKLMTENADSEWLFGDPRDMYRPFHDLMAGLGLEAKGNPHILRHSRATHLLQSGVDLYAVARLLGDSVATVERVYGHHTADYLAEAIKGAS